MNNVVQLPLANRIHAFIEEMNRNYAVVAAGSSVRILWETRDPAKGGLTVRFLPLRDFQLLTMNLPAVDPEEKSSAANFWLKHPKRREYQAVNFLPGPDTPEGTYNLWRGFAVKPNPGRTEKFWRFVKEVICGGSEAAYRYVRKWLAHSVQRTNELPGTALVLRGEQGIGKNTFVDTIGRLFGEHHIAVSSLGQITGRFSGHLADKVLVHANEAIWGGNKAEEGTLKAMITDDKMAMESKGRDIITVNNYKRLIVSSNEQWAVPRGLDDRRFFVVDVSSAHKEDQAYFGGIREELEHGGLEALMHDLLHEDLAGFNVRVMPNTGAGLDMKLKSATSSVRWLYELLNGGYRVDGTGKWAPELEVARAGGAVDKATVFDNYLGFCSTDPGRPEQRSEFFKKLRKALPSVREERDTRETAGVRIRRIVFPDLATARKEFEVFVKQPGTIDWDEEPLPAVQFAHHPALKPA